MAARGRMCKACRTVNGWRYTYCQACKVKLPKRRVAVHNKALDSMSYEALVARDGEKCSICGRGRKPGGRRLHRDHDHRTGQPRALLCFPCNAALRSYMTPDWLRRAAAYLERSCA